MVQETRKRAIIHSATLDLASVGAGAEIDTAVTLPASADVKVGDVAVVNAPALEAGLVATASVTGDNEVTIRVTNVTGLGVDPASQDFHIVIFGG